MVYDLLFDQFILNFTLRQVELMPIAVLPQGLKLQSAKHGKGDFLKMFAIFRVEAILPRPRKAGLELL